MYARKIVLLDPETKKEVEVWQIDLHLPGQSGRTFIKCGGPFPDQPLPIDRIYKNWLLNVKVSDSGRERV